MCQLFEETKVTRLQLKSGKRQQSIYQGKPNVLHSGKIIYVEV